MNGVGLLLGYRRRRVGTLVLAAVLLLGAWAHAFHLVAAFSVPGYCTPSGHLAGATISDCASDAAPCHDVAQCDHCRALASSSGLETATFSLHLADAPPAMVASAALRIASTRPATHLTRGPPVL